MSDMENLPTPADNGYGDGWNDAEVNDRVIQGELLKCVDGNWSLKSGGTPPKRLLALATTTVIQLWKGKAPVKTFDKRYDEPWPKLDDLNDEIPEDEWELGLDGKPRAPWQRQHVIYLLDPETAAIYTYANGTAGANQATSNLKDAIKWQRAIRGDHVVPLVELANRVMPTAFGQKLRPHFQVIEWRNLDVSFTGTAPALPPPEKDLNDKLPF